MHLAARSDAGEAKPAGAHPRVVDVTARQLALVDARFDGDGNPFGDDAADRMTTATIEDVDGVECLVTIADVDRLVSAHADAELQTRRPMTRMLPSKRTDSVAIAVPLAELRRLIANHDHKGA